MFALKVTRETAFEVLGSKTESFAAHHESEAFAATLRAFAEAMEEAFPHEGQSVRLQVELTLLSGAVVTSVAELAAAMAA